MKKMALILAAALLGTLLLGGCGAAKSPEPTEAPLPAVHLAGGWSASERLDMTEDAQAAFDKATEGLVGASYTPVALLGTQVVAGTNYCILCRAQLVVAEPAPYYALVYVYRDLQGGAQLLGIEPLQLGVPEE